MTLLVNLLLSLAFAGGAAAAVQFWRIHLDSARRDEMQAVAARRGWALTVTGERLGRAGTLRLVPRGGHPWLAEARPKDGATVAATLFEAEAPRWAEGTLVMAPDPTVEGPRQERATRDLLGEELARLVAGLQPVPAPPGVLAWSDAQPALRVDMADLARVMTEWRPLGRGPRGLPAMALSPEGLRLRLGTPLKRPEQMERFVDLALELSRLIGP